LNIHAGLSILQHAAQSISTGLSRNISIGIPNSNTLYEKYELELFVIISYDKAIKEAYRDFC
tara:strand:+ start:274 stop:459 length:186 start_codon:yes stop_codon:yes gene_type:complete